MTEVSMMVAVLVGALMWSVGHVTGYRRATKDGYRRLLKTRLFR